MLGVDLKKRHLYVCDEVGCVNTNTNGRLLHSYKTKNIFIQSEKTFWVSFTGFQPINDGKAYIQPKFPNTAVDFVNSSPHLILKNTQNVELMKHLFATITNPNLNDNHIKKKIHG